MHVANIALAVLTLGPSVAESYAQLGRGRSSPGALRSGGEGARRDAALLAAGPGVAAATDRRSEAVPFMELSTVVQCLIVVIVQYFAFHLLGLISKVSHWLCDIRNGAIQKSLENVSIFMNMLPMIGMLIITSQLQAEGLMRGQRDPETYGIPQWWNATGLRVTVGAGGILAMLFQTLSTVSAPADPGQSGILVSMFFAGFRTAFTFVQYLGISVVLVGVTFMHEPFDVWLNRGRIGPSAPLVCMINLAIQFFLTFLVLLAATASDEFHSRATGFLAKAAKAGALAQRLVPAIAATIAVAGLRSTDTSHEAGEVQRWAQIFLSLCVDSVLVHTVLAISVTCMEEAREMKSRLERDGSRGRGFVLFNTLRALAMLCVFVGIGGIAVSILLCKAPNGWSATPKMSPVQTCTLVIAMQYVIVHGLSSAAGLCEQVRSSDVERRMSFTDAAEAAKDSSAVCPMLCVVFLAARIQAFQVDAKASPQTWVEECVFACMLASVLHAVLMIVMIIMSFNLPAEAHPSAPHYSLFHFGVHVDFGGEVEEETPQPKGKLGGFFLVACQAICLAIVYAGVAGIVTGIFYMTPQTVTWAV
eukprot:CAMPEP_0179187138 /NCGR_PEP_ID=MMETSP0796-20121207/92850_1 /TAXON_ID=73915 /ORGANISM="Pyrodinium bahamense, Strain pbaha01" /LENGTH=587 /DNA_ID=CAMNT_0020891189 /DNA_START=114 /DNA_END=1878 /DNA_ORIENTATION=+